MLIMHLFAAIITGICAVALGWATGNAGWVSLVLYSVGGMGGLLTSALYVASQPTLHCD